MRKAIFIGVVAVTSTLLAIQMRTAAAQLPANSPPPATDAATQRAVLDKYCVGCHNDRMAATGQYAGLSLQKVDLSNIGAHTDALEKVVRKLSMGAMPPVGMPRPDDATRTALVTWLETSLDKYAAANPNPGRASLHRLNRAEYGNAVRDLLGVEVDVTSYLPSDNSSYGFDNVAAVLGMSPTLMARYVSASAKIARLAVGSPNNPEVIETYKVRADLTQEDHLEGMPVGTRGGVLVQHTFPLDGEYLLRVRLQRGQNDIVRGLAERQQLEFTLDGVRLLVIPFGGDLVLDGEFRKGLHGDEGLEVRVPVKAGLRTLTAAFFKKSSATSNDALQPLQRANINATDQTAQPAIEALIVEGPFNGAVPHETVSRSRIFTCHPKGQADERTCARTILSNLAKRAYRRPVTERDVQQLLVFYDAARKEGNFESGVEEGLRRILVSPAFLFRAEPDPAGLGPGKAYALSNLQLASRVSFFLWSSIPDEELLNVAIQGKLTEPAMLDRQVRRMLGDPRAQALMTNFFGQWLELRRIDQAYPDPELFPDFNHNLREAFKRETELFTESIVREDRSVLDLLDADYTFVNERLARQYQIPNVYGSQFRRVTVTDENRRGLLGQGSILLVTSYANRTSPVRRGKWILENILGTPPPDPPPNIPPFPESNGKAAKSVRARLEEHRRNPACASCHRIMDPLGFGLENFDATGAWRTTDAGETIEPSGTLLDGSTFQGVAGMRKALLTHSDAFTETLTRKLMTYALGRGVEPYDMPSVRAITKSAAANKFRFSSLIVGIVKSTPFRMSITKAEGEPSLSTAQASPVSQPR